LTYRNGGERHTLIAVMKNGEWNEEWYELSDKVTSLYVG
jgi:hypothetical protein